MANKQDDLNSIRIAILHMSLEDAMQMAQELFENQSTRRYTKLELLDLVWNWAEGTLE